MVLAGGAHRTARNPDLPTIRRWVSRPPRTDVCDHRTVSAAGPEFLRRRSRSAGMRTVVRPRTSTWVVVVARSDARPNPRAGPSSADLVLAFGKIGAKPVPRDQQGRPSAYGGAPPQQRWLTPSAPRASTLLLTIPRVFRALGVNQLADYVAAPHRTLAFSSRVGRGEVDASSTRLLGRRGAGRQGDP